MLRNIVLLSLLVLLLLPAALADGLKIADIVPGKEYVVEVEEQVQLESDDHAKRLYYLAQGSATDGEFAYVISLHRVSKDAAVWKVNLSDWSVTDMVHGLPLGHGNDATYNPKTNELLVVNLDDPNAKTLTVIDPDTLTVTGQKQLPFGFYAIAYNALRDQYVFGLGGSYDFVITDGDFNYIATHTGVDTGLTRQGVECDDKYIYFPHWDYKKYKNYLLVYDWDGNFVTQMDVKNYMEIESVFNVDGELYITFLSNNPRIFSTKIVEK